MKIKAIFLAVSLVAGVASNASADAKTDALKQSMMKHMPGLTIDSLKPAAVAGMYEMVSGSEIAYVSEDGEHMIQGTLYSVSTRKNLTEQTLSTSRAKIMKTLDPASLLVYPAIGKAIHTITVFTDPSCPYCTRLHSEIPKLNGMGITVKYALFSRSGNSTLTGRQLSEVLCAADKKAVMAKMFAAPTRESAGAECAASKGLERIATVATQVGLQGTPYIVTDKGVGHSGYQPAEELLKTLNGG